MDKILIIQDSPSINIVLKSRLESAGFSVEAAETGEEGIRKANGGKYQLILLDLNLPGMSGIEVSRILKGQDNTKGMPIVLISAMDEEEVSKRMKGIYVDGYIAIPFEGKDFIEKIKGFIKNSYFEKQNKCRKSKQKSKTINSRN